MDSSARSKFVWLMCDPLLAEDNTAGENATATLPSCRSAAQHTDCELGRVPIRVPALCCSTSHLVGGSCSAPHLQSLAGNTSLQVSPTSQVSSQALGVNSLWVTCSQPAGIHTSVSQYGPTIYSFIASQTGLFERV